MFVNWNLNVCKSITFPKTWKLSTIPSSEMMNEVQYLNSLCGLIFCKLFDENNISLETKNPYLYKIVFGRLLKYWLFCKNLTLLKLG